MFSEHVIVALIVFIGGIVTTMLGWYASKMFGIGPQQQILVKTLQDVIEAQTDRISQLETQIKDQTTIAKKQEEEIGDLTARVKALEKVIVDQQKELDRLYKRAE